MSPSQINNEQGKVLKIRKDGEPIRVMSKIGSPSEKSVLRKFMQSVTLPRVLYADDNEDSCFMLSTLLGFSNIETKSTNTVDGALKLAHAEHFDLYLLESRFPEGSGFDLCRELHEFNPQTPIVFYSGDAYEKDKAKAFAAGADAYLVKPESDGIAKIVFQLIKKTKREIRAPSDFGFSYSFNFK